MERTQCPKCRANLKSASPLTAGKRIRCPKCRELFTIPGQVNEQEEDTVLIDVKEVETPEALASLAKRGRSQQAADEAGDEDPEEEPAGKPAARNNRSLLLAAGAGVLILVIAVILIMWRS